MTVDVVFCLDLGMLRAVLAAVNSAAQNASRPGDLRFTLVVPPAETECFDAAVKQCFPNRDFALRIVGYTAPADLADYLSKRYRSRSTAREMSYSRLFLKDVDRDFQKLIYLDPDVVVLGDLGELFHHTELNSERFFAAVPHPFPALFYFASPLKALTEIIRMPRTFNAGVFVTDLGHWTTETELRLRRYMTWDASLNYKLLNLGDEPLLNLVFKNFLPLDRRWNSCGYGNIRALSWLLSKRRGEKAIIHWSGGHYKPWNNPQTILYQVWHQYDVLTDEETKKICSEFKPASG